MSTPFEKLGLSAPIRKALLEKRYTKPTPIQEQAIPAILKGGDVMAAAQTGTGKTASFTLPLLHKLSKLPYVKGRRIIRVLILTPTRELAAQVLENVRTYSSHLKLRSHVVFGGVKINPQIANLRGGVDVLVATPGRLLDLNSQGVLNLSQVEHLVLDEADRMLDMGFIPDIKRIIKFLPKERQTLLFSATYSEEIRKLSAQFLKTPKLIEIEPEQRSAKTVQHYVYKIEKARKTNLLTYLINSGKWKQVLVFTRTKHGGNRLCEKLNRVGITASVIHSNKSQSARTNALADFKEGKVRVLVATDIAARGLDIKQLPYVVNFELPNVPEDYVHRIGRTGRAEEKGHAISLVCEEEEKFLKSIEELLKHPIEVGIAPGFKSWQAQQSKHKGGGAPAYHSKHKGKNTKKNVPKKGTGLPRKARKKDKVENPLNMSSKKKK